MAGDDQELTLRDLIARLIDSGKAYARAELLVLRKSAKLRLVEARWAAMFGTGALILALAGAIVLVAALGLLLARWIGPAGGMAVAGLLALVVAGLLGWRASVQFIDWKKPK